MKPEGARLTSAGVKHFNLRQQLFSLYLQRFGPVRKHVQSKRVPAASCVITWLWSPTKVAMKEKVSGTSRSITIWQDNLISRTTFQMRGMY